MRLLHFELANETLAEPLSQPELHDLAAGIGADVPFFLRPGTQLAVGDGTELERIELPLDYEVLLVVPHRRGEAAPRRPCTRTSTPEAAPRASTAERPSSGGRSTRVEVASRAGGAPAERSRVLTSRGRSPSGRRVPRGRHGRRPHRLRALRRPCDSAAREAGARQSRLEHAHPPRVGLANLSASAEGSRTPRLRRPRADRSRGAPRRAGTPRRSVGSTPSASAHASMILTDGSRSRVTAFRSDSYRIPSSSSAKRDQSGFPIAVVYPCSMS